MSLLFDQNLSWRLPGRLANEYPASTQVIAVGLSNAEDRAVWAFAASKGLAVVSKDRDFFDLATAHGPPPKLIWLRVGNGPTRRIEALLRSRLADVTAFLADPGAAILVLP
jgi:predicted nuclease of predicted toxin-antitoxin system